MACPTITLNGTTADVWDCLRRQASSMGISIPSGAGGSVRHAEGDADYTWDEAADTLAVTFTRTPGWISCADIESRMRLAASRCGAG